MASRRLDQVSGTAELKVTKLFYSHRTKRTNEELLQTKKYSFGTTVLTLTKIEMNFSILFRMRRDVVTSRVRPRMMAKGRLTTETLREILLHEKVLYENNKLTQK